MLSLYLYLSNLPVLLMVWFIEKINVAFGTKIGENAAGFAMVFPFIWALLLIPLIVIITIVMVLI